MNLDKDTNAFKSRRRTKSKGHVKKEATPDTLPTWSTSGALSPKNKKTKIIQYILDYPNLDYPNPKSFHQNFFFKPVLEKPVEIFVVCSNCCPNKSNIQQKHRNNTFFRCYCCYHYKSLLKFTKSSWLSFVVGLSVCQAFQFSFSLSIL